MGIFSDILKSVTKPGRDLAEINRLISTVRSVDPSVNKKLNTLDKRLKAQKKVEEYTPVYQTQEEQLGTFLKPVETTLRNAATVGSLVAPVGVAGNIASRAGAGALGGGLASYGMTPITEDVDLLKILGGIGLGATVGGATGALEKGIMSKAQKATPSKISEFGLETRGKSIGLDPNKLASSRGTSVSSSTQGKKVIKSYFDTMDSLGLPTHTSEIASQSSDDALKVLNEQFNGVLTNADNAVSFTSKDTTNIVNKINNAFKNNPKITSNAQYKELLGDLLSLGDNYSPSQLNTVREKARELVNWSSLSKAATSQRATSQIFDVIDDFFKSKIGGTREVLGKMKDIYTVRPVFQAKAPTAGNIKIGTASTNIAVPSGAIQERIPSMVGETLQKGVNIPQLSPEVLSKIGATGVFGTRLGQALGYSNQPQTEATQSGLETQPVEQKPQINEAILVQAILNGQLTTADAKFIMDTLGGGTGGQKLTEKQKLFKSAGQTAEEALSILESGAAKTGKIQGVQSSIGKFFGTQDPAQTEYLAKLDGARMAAISALSGANVPPSEYERMRNLIPEPNDEYNVAVQKLRSFKQVMDTYAQSYGGTSDTTNILQTLGLQ